MDRKQNKPNLLFMNAKLSLNKRCLALTNIKQSVSFNISGLLDFTDTFVDYDPILVGVGPSNPWMSDDIAFWEINKPM